MCFFMESQKTSGWKWPCKIIWSKPSSDLENLHWWELYHIPGEVPVIGCYHCKKDLSYTKMKPILGATCLLPVWRELLPPLSSQPVSTEELWWGPPKPSLLQGEKTWLLQSFLIGHIPKPFDHFHGIPLDFLQSVCIFLALWGSGLDTVLQVRSDKCQVEWDDHISMFTNKAS